MMRSSQHFKLSSDFRIEGVEIFGDGVEDEGQR